MQNGNYTCKTCEDTGRATVQNGPDDYDVVACPDCELGIAIMEKERGRTEDFEETMNDWN